jgi:hypothetical protein
MWKPGSAKPAAQEVKSPFNKTPNSKQRNARTPKSEPARHAKANNDSLLTLSSSSHQQKQPSSTGKTKLTGATMNMRFMKRKDENQHYANNRKSPKEETLATRETSAAMEVDDNNNDDDSSSSYNEQEFAQATPSEMYGVQSDLMGRRSFGGFNPAMEDAWAESRGMIENQRQETLSEKQRVSDEELVKRYQQLVQKRVDSRPTGGRDHHKRKRSK